MVDFDAGAVHFLFFTIAEVLIEDEVVIESLLDYSWTAPAQATFLTFIKIFSCYKDEVSFVLIGEFTAGTLYAHVFTPRA